MIPRFALFTITTSHPHDDDCTGPEYAGRTLSIAWLGFVLEITVARKPKV